MNPLAKDKHAFDNLCQTLSRLTTTEEVAAFLRDIATLKELKDMSERLAVARLIHAGVSYRKIHEKTGMSTATITRIAHWVRHGVGGYKHVFETQ